MDTIISSVVTEVVQSLMVPIKKHLGFLVSSSKYVKDMKEKIDQLNHTEKDIRDSWEEAVARNHEVSNHVLPWFSKVKTLNEKAQSIPSGGSGCFSMGKRYKAGKQSYYILQEVQELEEWKSKIVFTNVQIPLAKVVSAATGPSTSTPDGARNTFESRDLIYKSVLKSIKSNDESQKMIALCGMGGIGKTTMMEQLEKEVKATKVFDWVVKVVLGENPDPIALQRAIAIYIDQKDLTEETKDARADRLCKMFEEMSKQKKNVLVIMDDLWKAFDLKDVGLSPLPNGFKMLFTSRDERICTHMGVKIDSIFKVGLLNDVEANTLFFGIVGLPEGDDPALQKIGEEIVKKCCGLPIAIVTIAKSLSGNIHAAWEVSLRRLEKDDLKDIESISHRIFEMSYENLQDDCDKAIFLLSGLFPDDYNIRTEDLLRFGWGLGFFKDAKTLATARIDMEVCVSNLIRANLLTESDHDGCVKMHDLVRAFVLNKISEVKQASISNYDNMSTHHLTKDAKDSYERILLNCKGMDAFPVDFNHPNLSFLALMDGNELLEFPDTIYESMERLKVVSYENMHIPSLLLTFEYSTILQTLCLRSCRLINDDISSIGNLCNLETLSLIDCEISSLPSTIGKLKKLKLLDLTGSVQLRIDNGVFQNLVSLEELYMRASKDYPIRFTGANCDELEKVSQGLIALELEFFKNNAKPEHVSFNNLERFRISIGCQLTELKNNERYSFRNTIRFIGDYNELRESQVSDLFKKTEKLYLRVNDMSYLEDHSFSNLKVLGVYNCRDLTNLFTLDVASGLKKLECLKVFKCHVMRTLVDEGNRIKKISFPKLKFMSLTGLPKMVSFWDDVIEFPEMVELVLDDLPNFTSIYPQNHYTSEIKSLLNEKVVIPQLQELSISKMKNLRYIWSCETSDKDSVSMLRNIEVRECDNLRNLFPNNPLPLLSHLEELDVEKCGSIEVLFNMEFESDCEALEYGSGNLKRIKVDNLEKLKELWRIKGVDKCDIHINCFKHVESIEIEKCSIFKNLFTPTTVNFDLGALTNYTTKNSGEKINAIVKEEISQMDKCIPNSTFTTYLLHKCHHLQHLNLHTDRRVEEVVFEMDSHQPLQLPYLEVLHLQGLKEMCRIWNCDWNKILSPQHQPLQFPFQNLREVVVWLCDKINYLFSPLMVKYLSNLKKIHIVRCNGIEEVISSRDDRNEEIASTSTHTSFSENSTFFPLLDILEIWGLSCLKSIDDQSQRGQVIGECWSLYATKIMIYECDALPVLIPWYAVGQMKRLQMLEIRECKAMTEVFECESITNNLDKGSADGITNTVVAPQLSNLKHIRIYKCDLLSHVFTFSTLESLKQLKVLNIAYCEGIQVIVKEENGTSMKDVVFPHLKSLVLENLPNLKGFYLGMNNFRWPLLDDVMIVGCPQLLMFTSGQSKAPKLKYLRTWLGKHNATISETQATFPCSTSNPMLWTFHNLIEINVTSIFSEAPILIPSSKLPHLEKLEKIHIHGCFAVEEVFEVLALEGNESETNVTIPNLTQVDLDGMRDLTYLWKSNRWMTLEFPNLTTLSISRCHQLKHVVTCSMIGSLVQLQYLHISYCENVKVIVKDDDDDDDDDDDVDDVDDDDDEEEEEETSVEGEEEATALTDEEEEEEKCDVKVNEIMFPRLKSLILEDLESLEGFCFGRVSFSWPALDTLKIKECPTITIFTNRRLSTPKLKVIDTTFGMYHMKTDLNSFIKTKQEEGYKF